MPKPKPAKTRGRPEKPNKLSHAFNVACDSDTFNQIEQYRQREPRMSQSEAVRRLIEGHLKTEGLR